MALTLAIQKAALAAAAAARQNPQRSLKKWWTKSRYKSGCDSCLEGLPTPYKPPII